MTGFLGLLSLSLWILWLCYREGKERASVSRAVWIVVAWAVIYGSRPVTEWFTGAGQELRSRDEGNPIEALISFSLILAGLIVLLRRGVRFPAIISENTWLFVFYGFWLMSIAWSDDPLITFKRLFKDLGNVVMVLVVLTEREPSEAMKSLCARVAYLCIPLSILLIRYYPDWGRVNAGYDQSELMNVGVATHKNTLGVLGFVGAVFLLWDLIDLRGKHRNIAEKATLVSRVLMLLTCWYVLAIVDSATSLVCALLGSGLLIVFSLPSMGRNFGRVEAFGLGAVAILWLLDSAFKVKDAFVEAFVQSLGRDTTLTSRTDFWPILIGHQDNPLLGVGFNSFWTGHRLMLLPESLRTNVQAHNGYLETYLNGGLVGVALLVVLLLSAYRRIRKQLLLGAPEATIRLVVLLVAVLYNYSEASFNKIGLLWVVTLFAITEYRWKPPSRQAVPGGIHTGPLEGTGDH